MKSNMKYSCLAIAVVTAITSQSAFTQENDVKRKIEVIQVTVQKRVQSMQDIPASMSAYGERELKENQVLKIDDIISATPNLSFTPFSGADPQLSIRGVSSSADGVGGDPSVVVFINDVAINRAGGANLDIYDLERVEVLRGPQGTLYGKNAVGGTVNFITKAPEDFYNADVSLTVGNYDFTEFKGHVNLPISDNTALRLSGLSKDRGGIQRNIITNKDVDTQDTKSIRAQLSHNFSDDFTALFSAEYTKNDTLGGSRVASPLGTFATDGYDEAGVTPNTNLREVEPNTEGYFNRDVLNGFIKLTKEIDIGTITSITSYRDTSFDWLQDLIGLPIELTQLKTVNLATENDQQFTQELRINGLSFSDKFNWVAGLYYSTEDIDRSESYDRTYRFLENQDPLPGISLVSYPEFDQSAKIDSKAIFAQGTYELTDLLNITLGGRYTIDDKNVNLGVNDLLAGNTPAANEIYTLAPADEIYAISASDSWSSFTPKLAIDYRFSKDIMVYTSISKGYKAGGFQSAPGSKIAAEQSFDPEEVTNYEVGSKTQWFDDTLRINANIFYMDYSNLQFFELVGTGADSLLVVQSTNADISGLEFELLARPINDLEISVNYALLNAELGDYVNAAGQDFTGKDLARSPDSNYSVAVSYLFNIADKGIIKVRAAYENKGDQFFDIGNTTFGHESGYGLLNTSVRYESIDGTWSVTAWAKNLTDELYRATSLIAVDSGFSRMGAPRTFGLTFNKFFE